MCYERLRTFAGSREQGCPPAVLLGEYDLIKEHHAWIFGRFRLSFVNELVEPYRTLYQRWHKTTIWRESHLGSAAASARS